jgi:hypothetical protein
MAVRLSALRAGRPLPPPGRFLVLISVRGSVDPRAIVRLEGLGQLKNPIISSGNRTRDLPACSIIHQLHTLPRAQEKYLYTYLLPYLLTYGPESFLRSCNCAATHELPRLPCSQEPSTGPYPEPDRSSPYHPILSL